MFVRGIGVICLTLILLALGVSIEFGDRDSSVDTSIFFEIAADKGEAPGHDLSDQGLPGEDHGGRRFLFGGQPFEAPILLTVPDSDPGELPAPYPGPVIPLDLEDVPAELFLQPKRLFEVCEPEHQFVELLSEGLGRVPMGPSTLFWIGAVIAAVDRDGRSQDFLLFGVVVEETEPRFPTLYRSPRVASIRFRASERGGAFRGNFSQQTLRFEGPPDRPTKLALKVSVQFAPE